MAASKLRALPRDAAMRVVYAECPTPHLWRWLLSQLTYVAHRATDREGFVVHDESRWAALLGAAEGRELSSQITLRDKGRGRVVLTVRDGVVVGAMGSEPERFMGLTTDAARRLAAGHAQTRVKP